MKKNNLGLKEMTLYAFFIALTCVGTLVIRIPVPITQGYLNIGDVVIIAVSIAVGRQAGMVAGGLGSFLADVLTGYAYAPATLVIKGLQGFLCGLVFEKIPSTEGRILAALVGGTTMVAGYFVFEAFLVGVYPAGVAALANLVQGTVGAIGGYLLAIPLEKVLANRLMQSKVG